MSVSLVKKSNITFRYIKLEPNGYFTGEIDAWDLPFADIHKLNAEHMEILEINGYADFNKYGMVTKVYGLTVWCAQKSLYINPTEDLIYELEKKFAYKGKS